MVFYDAYWVEMMEWFFNVAGRFLLLVTPHFGGFKAWPFKVHIGANGFLVGFRTRLLVSHYIL